MPCHSTSDDIDKFVHRPTRAIGMHEGIYRIKEGLLTPLHGVYRAEWKVVY
jgi:hypothetical protein